MHFLIFSCTTPVPYNLSIDLNTRSTRLISENGKDQGLICSQVYLDDNSRTNFVYDDEPPTVDEIILREDLMSIDTKLQVV